MRQHWIFLAVMAISCSGDKPDQPKPNKPIPQKPDTKNEAPKKSFKLSPEELKKGAKEIALVPSPAEMQKALSNAGLSSQLSKMVASDKDVKMDVVNKDQIAVRTGVVLADLVLTVKDSPEALMLTRLGKLKQGFQKLGGGEDIQQTIDEMSNNIKSKAISRNDLLKEMDELSGVLVPELEYEAGEWVVPLIQAGSWLEGSHLVSGAIVNEKKFDAGSKLLRQPQVVDYFLKYVQREGRSKAPDKVVQHWKLHF
jgi:hypothetical protein